MRCHYQIVMLLGCALLFFSNAWADEDRLVDVSPRGELVFEQLKSAKLAYVLFPDAAKSAEFIAQHKNQLLRYDVVDTDRYGRAQIVLYGDANAVSMQQQMLRVGLAVLYSSESFGDAKNWVQDEAIGRSPKAGFWVRAESIVAPEQAAATMNKFAMVQGTVTNIYRARDAYYINFGARWQEDFSIKIPRKAWRNMEMWIAQFEQQLFLTRDRESARMIVDTNHPVSLRVRGAVISENGPLIIVNQPHQLELLTVR